MRRRFLLLTPLILILGFAPGLKAQRHARRHDDDSDRGTWLERCRRENDRDTRARYCEERAMGWSSRPGASLTVDASPNGGVSVSGWDRDSVHVIVRIQTQAGSDAEAHDLAAQIRVTNDNGTLNVTGPGSRRWASWSVSYEIYAPKRTDLALTTLNGPLEVEEVTGTMRLSAVNGPLSLGSLGGDVRAHAQNGPLAVRLEGTRWNGAGLDAETQNGPIVVDVPEGYNAELETGTVNGPMEIGFPVTVQGRIGAGSHQRLRTTLGAGGPPVRIVTTNGPAVIRRN